MAGLIGCVKKNTIFEICLNIVKKPINMRLLVCFFLDSHTFKGDYIRDDLTIIIY